MLVIWYTVGPDGTHILVEIHHNGFFYGVRVNHTYVDEKVDWFDHMDVELWCYFWVVEFVTKLWLCDVCSQPKTVLVVAWQGHF
jgi:hypothetical protein